MPALPVAKPNTDLLTHLQRLTKACAVLHIGAHPDDEDVGLMAYLARCCHVRIVYWSATRGEGGENRIGPYKGDALGLYRTWESLSAREVDGGEAMFGPFYDFGFSKFGEETLKKWGRASLIGEIVRAIRLVQPAVVISRWSGIPQDGHGHHIAIGSVITEAFDAAGDPAQFSHLHLPGWLPRKLYYSTLGDWEPGVNSPMGKRAPEYEREGFVRINAGEFDTCAGRTYQEQAWIGFNSHKTQAMGFAPEPGDFYYYYTLGKSLLRQDGREQGLFDGLEPELTGLAGYPGGLLALQKPLERITALAHQAIEQYRLDCPLEAGRSLLDGLAGLRLLRQQVLAAPPREETWALERYFWRKEIDFETAAARCLGLRLECLSDDARVTPAQQFCVFAQLWNQAGIQIEDAAFTLHTPVGWAAVPIPAPQPQAQTLHARTLFQVTVPETADLATPYWLQKPHGPYAYEWGSGAFQGLPFGPHEVELSCQVYVAGQSITLRETAVLRQTFAGGFRELPVAVVPPISIQPRLRQAFLPTSTAAQSIELDVILRSNSEKSDVSGQLTLAAPPGWQVDPQQVEVSLVNAGDTRSLAMTVTIPPGTTAGRYRLGYSVQVGQRHYDVILEPVRMVAPGLPGYPDETNCIQEEFIAVPADTLVDLIDVEFVPGLKYGYVKGSAEQLVESLAHFPLEFHLLDDNAIGYADLSQFDAVVVGPDAYLVRDELCKNANRFLEYTARGGTLIVLRQGYAYQGCSFSPYPIQYHEPNDEVTSEEAPVRCLQLDHPLLNLPNAICDADFAGWVVDRGNFFMGEWDARYTSLLSCSDPGEDPKCGGLLVAPYEQGTYLYCAYSLCRQLPAGVPGAFRLLANLLALPVERILECARWLKRAAFFSSMSKEGLMKVARITRQRVEGDGVYLCRQGEPADAIYQVIRGQVEVIKEMPDLQRVAVAGPGETIGELDVLAGQPRHIALRTRGDVLLLSIAGPDLVRLLHEDVELMERVIQVMAGELAALGSY
jgi:LmbE family N-acetylglucosaminyl deacetylase